MKRVLKEFWSGFKEDWLIKPEDFGSLFSAILSTSLIAVIIFFFFVMALAPFAVLLYLFKLIFKIII